MAIKQVTSEDILRSEIKITEEQTKYRHEQNARFQETLIHLEESMDKKIDTILNRFDLFEEKMEKKFASKWTENVLIWVMGAMGIAIIGSLMSLILIK